MFDFNMVSQKTTEDFQEALQVEHNVDTFKQNMNFYIEKYGLDSCLNLLGYALLGNAESGLKPLIKFNQRIIDDSDPYNEGHLVPIEVKVCGKCGDTVDHRDVLRSAGHDLD